MREELSVSYKHRVGTSYLIVESYHPFLRRKYYVSYALLERNGEEVCQSSSPRLRSYEEAYQWAWDQIMDWCLNG